MAEKRTILGASTTILNSASLSSAIGIGDLTLLCLQMPSAWTAANLTFQASLDGATYANVYGDDGTEYTVTADASRVIYLDPSKFAGMTHVKIRSGTSGAPVSQGGNREILLSLGAVLAFRYM